MKTKISFFLMSFFAFTNYANSKPNNCIDATLINPNAICPAVYAPVCGCDGVTYGNSCEAEAAGVASYSEGDCGNVVVNGCVDVALINPNAICPEIYAPVCGCDSITYENVCRAEANGITSYFSGDCNNLNGCIDSSLIDPTLACPLYYSPVCGCNGITYGNECEASINGVINFYYGTCNLIPDCSAYAYFYYSFDSTGKTVYFMNFSAGVNHDGSIDNDTINSGSPNSGLAGLTLTWDFGDGNTSSDVNPIHTYSDSASGKYIVCLTVYDSINDCSNQYCETLFDYIYSGNCGANFDWDVVYDSINGRDSVVFFNNTPNAEDPNIVVSWSYGDGSMVNGAIDSLNILNPDYSYNEDGDYTVCMSVSDLNTGCFDIVCNTVEYRKFNSIVNKQKQQQEFSLYPNPVRNVAFISINIAENNADIKFIISDLSGRLIQSFEKKNVPQGKQTFEWNTEGAANGIYIIHLQSGDASGFKRISVLH